MFLIKSHTTTSKHVNRKTVVLVCCNMLQYLGYNSTSEKLQLKMKISCHKITRSLENFLHITTIYLTILRFFRHFNSVENSRLVCIFHIQHSSP